MLERIKQSYILWHEYYSTLPKIHRYTIGERVDTLFIEILEAVSGAAYLPKDKKLPYISLSIRKLNTLTVLLMILWETKSLRDKKYITLSVPLDDIGKMLGGWQGQLQKQNSPAQAGGEMKRVADAREPPVVVPVVVVAVDVHVTLVVPPVERGNCAMCHLCHHSSKANISPSCISFGIAMPQHTTPSIFYFLSSRTPLFS